MKALVEKTARRAYLWAERRRAARGLGQSAAVRDFARSRNILAQTDRPDAWGLARFAA